MGKMTSVKHHLSVYEISEKLKASSGGLYNVPRKLDRGL
jgi:hypothetical protein